MSQSFKEDLRGRKCNVRWTCGPSAHRFRQGGLDLITFNFPPAITFPVDHFPSQVRVCIGVCSRANAAGKGKKNEKGEVYVFKAKVFVVEEMALQTVGYLICNLISMAQPFRGWVNLIFCLDWVTALMCVCVSVCPYSKKLNTSEEPLRGPTPFPSEASMEHLTG